MGEILLAQLRGPGGFERAVVIKRILPHLAEEAASIRMFLDEARIAAGIRHANVIQVQELIQEDQNLCIVMEYLEGESLSGVMRRLRARTRSLPLNVCCHIVAELAAGLHAAHELKDADGNPGGLVHRDVSPQNTFITYDGSIKVLDFGIAYFHNRGTKTQTGTLRGKFEYMSPEQCLAKALDRRSDVFAAGVVLYELTTGHRLFRRKNQLLTLRAIVEEDIRRPSEVVENYPPDLEAVVLRALAKDPDDRYASAAELRRQLVHVGQALGPGDLADETLAALMEELFLQRRDEKHAMLQRLRDGAVIEKIPSPEVDVHVDLPTLEEVQPSVVSKEDPSEAASADATGKPVSPSVRARVAGGVAALALAGATAVLLFMRNPQDPSVDALASVPPPAMSSASAVASTVLASASHPPARPNLVSLRVESNPTGARVSMDGSDQGQAPVDIEVPRNDMPVRLELHLSGHEPLVEEVVPDVDQRLRLVLKPKRRTYTPPPTKPEQTAPGYRRFD